MKLLDFIQKMEGIVRTTSSAEQRSRVQKDIQRYRGKINELVTDQDVSRMNAQQIRTLLEGSSADAPVSTSTHGSTARAGANASGSALEIADKIQIEAASPNCTDSEINMLHSMLHAIQVEYWPAMSDRHCQLDFSHSAERDGLRLNIDNAVRHLEVVTETIEEYATAENQDFREQLLKMKNRQTRTFIYETNEALKKLKAFLEKLAVDIQNRGGIISNKEDVLKFDERYENATMLNGYRVQEAILEMRQLVSEIITRLNLPNIKIRE
ncbi:MAG: hypothetical protein KDK39_17410 [Leptospiraceae bacterium]|nr:hypothetical protein [Leptospiraceae bacterium]